MNLSSKVNFLLGLQIQMKINHWETKGIARHEAFGNTKLVQDTTNNLYAQIDNNNPIAIKIWDTQITTNSYSGWQTLAAETVNGVNQVLIISQKLQLC